MTTQQVLVFIGPPGAGKGSISRICQDRLQWKKISTGDLCRKHIYEQTEIGKEIDFAIKSGKLVDDTLITEMVAKWLENQEKGGSIIFDGYPRTVVQATLFEKLIKSKFPSLKVTVIRLTLSDEEVIARLSTRYVCQNKECQQVYSIRSSAFAPRKENECDSCGHQIGRRSDDMPEAIEERLKGYYNHEQALIDLYTQKGYIIPEVDMNQPIEKIFTILRDMMEGKA